MHVRQRDLDVSIDFKTAQLYPHHAAWPRFESDQTGTDRPHVG